MGVGGFRATVGRVPWTTANGQPRWPPQGAVVRDGQRIWVNGGMPESGDAVLLTAGDHPPAELRIRDAPVLIEGKATPVEGTKLF